MPERRDVFPAEVTAPDGEVSRRSRAWITDTELVYAHEDGGVTRVEIVGEPELAHPMAPRGSATHRVPTALGTFVVRSAPGCQCHLPRLAALSLETAVAA